MSAHIIFSSPTHHPFSSSPPFPQSAQGGNNKEEMARRASLEFASATNNTHLAPTIHHRGLDHPGEGGPAPQQQAPSQQQQQHGASTSADATKTESGKGASLPTPPGVAPGASAKKTPNNARSTSSCECACWCFGRSLRSRCVQ